MQVSLSLCVCVCFNKTRIPGCVFHKSSVIIRAVDMSVSGAAWLGWQQSSDHLMEQFISIMLHYQTRKGNISAQENRRTLKVFKKIKWNVGPFRDGWCGVVFGASRRATQQGSAGPPANIQSCSLLLFAWQPGLHSKGKQVNDAGCCN